MMPADVTSMQDVTGPEERQALPPRTTQWSRVIPLERLNTWQVHALREIQSVASLPVNWDSAGSPPPTAKAIKTAINHLRRLTELRDLWNPHVAPVSGGGIQLVWVTASRQLDLEVLPNGTIEYLVSEGKTPKYEGQLKASDYEVTKVLAAWVAGSQ